MSRNHRVIKRVHNHKYLHEPETLYEIREVYYDKDGKINGWSEMPDIIADSLDGLKWTLNKMMESCDKPVINHNTGEEEEEPQIFKSQNKRLEALQRLSDLDQELGLQ